MLAVFLVYQIFEQQKLQALEQNFKQRTAAEVEKLVQQQKMATEEEITASKQKAHLDIQRMITNAEAESRSIKNKAQEERDKIIAEARELTKHHQIEDNQLRFWNYALVIVSLGMGTYVSTH